MSRAAQRRKARRDRRNDRREAKQNRRDSRRQARLDRKQTRQDARTARVQSRTDRKLAAYESGIDPNAWIGNTISNVADSAGSVMSSRFQAQTMQRRDSMSADLAALGLDNPFNQTAMGTREGDGSNGGNNNMLLIIGAALVGFMLMKK